MATVTYIESLEPISGVTTTYAQIDYGNGEYTVMTKEAYEATLAANSAPQG